MDIEIVEICNAINKFKGLKTYSSCSGHGERPVEVWFHVSYPRALYPLLRAIDMRYGGPDGGGSKPWFVETMDTDLPKKPVTFVLWSRTVGAIAYEEAKMIADNLTEIAENRRVIEHFNIKLKGDTMKELKTLGEKFSEKANEVSEDDALVARLKQHHHFGNDIGMSEDAAFFISYIVGKLSKKVSRAKMRKYMAETVELIYDMNKENEK